MTDPRAAIAAAVSQWRELSVVLVTREARAQAVFGSLPDTVVADVEVCGDCCEGHTAAVEISGFSNLLSIERLASKLSSRVAE